MAKLGDFCRVIVDGDWIESKDQSENGIRLIQTGNIGIGEYLDKSNRAKYITPETFERLKCTEVLPGDILISRLPDPIGRACIVPKTVGKAITAVDCTVVRLETSLCDANYFVNYTQSIRYSNELSKFLAGTTRTRISRKNLEKIEIPLPSIDRQRKIAAQLDKVSDLIAKRRAQLDKLDLLVKARFVEMFGDPVRNSKNLPTMVGQDFFKLSNGKFVSENKRFDEGIPAYGGNGISWYTDEILYYGNTVVVGRVGFQSGNVHFVKGPLWITDNAMYISAYKADNYDLYFLYALMQHIDFTRFQDAGDLKKITQKPFMSMRYIMPTLAQQRLYVDFVEQINREKLAIMHSLEKMETLKKALMQQYFG